MQLDIMKTQSIIAIVSIVLYLLPSLIYLFKIKGINKYFVISNICLGITWVGWFAVLMWSISGDDSYVKDIPKKHPIISIVIFVIFVLVEIIILISGFNIIKYFN